MLRAWCISLYCLHLLLRYLEGYLQLFLLYVQVIPGTSILLFWPRYFCDLLLYLKGSSIFDMLTDPRYQTYLSQPNRVSRHTKGHFVDKGQVKIQPMQSKHYVHSSYQVDGAWAHLGTPVDSARIESAAAGSSVIVYPDDLLRLSQPYDYAAKRMSKPPDNAFMRLLACLSIIFIFLTQVTTGYSRLIWSKMSSAAGKSPNLHYEGANGATPPVHMPGPRGFVFVDTEHENCATTSASEGDAHASYNALTTETESTDWLPNQDRDQGELFDTDGIPFVMDNFATCIICNDRTQFIGNLQYQQSEISTSQATGVAEYVGTICLHLTDGAGQTFQYDIPGAVYDPSSPFNICGIPYLGEFFGKNDPISSVDDDGT